MIFPAGKQPPRTRCTATATITSCAWSGSLGCFRGTGSFHVCFIIPSSGVIHCSHTGHSSELFISAVDKKRKSWLYYPELVCLNSRQGSLDSCKQGCVSLSPSLSHTHLICLYRGNKVSHVCRASLNRAALWWIQNGDCWKTNFMYLLLVKGFLMTHILKTQNPALLGLLLNVCLDQRVSLKPYYN